MSAADLRIEVLCRSIEKTEGWAKAISAILTVILIGGAALPPIDTTPNLIRNDVVLRALILEQDDAVKYIDQQRAGEPAPTILRLPKA